MTYQFIYETEYKEETIKEVYQVKADSKNEAEYIMSFGAGDLINNHNFKNPKSMKLLKIEEVN